MIFSNVDFPEPFAPITPTNCPAGISSVTSSSAASVSTAGGRKSERRRSTSVVCRSCGMRNVFETCRTSMAFILEIFDEANLETPEGERAEERHGAAGRAVRALAVTIDRARVCIIVLKWTRRAPSPVSRASRADLGDFPHRRRRQRLARRLGGGDPRALPRRDGAAAPEETGG